LALEERLAMFCTHMQAGHDQATSIGVIVVADATEWILRFGVRIA
jgi:hypothetical protein